MNQKNIVPAILILVLLTGFAFSQEPNEHDIQVWNETKVYFGAIKKQDSAGKEQKILSPHLIGVIRIGQNVKHFVNERIGFGVDVRLNKYFKFTPSYLYVAEQKTRNKKAFEHRVRFDLTGSKKWGKVNLSQRGRVERRIKNSGDDSTRFRTKTKVAFPLKNSDGKEIVTPFVANETYYDFSKKEWSRNELAGGIGKKFSKKLSGEFFYMLQKNTGTTLRTMNIFGANFKITLD
jgi:hypothetical protein